MKKLCFKIIILLFSPNLLSHHAVVGIFDQDIQLILEGRVVDVSWRNPHVHFAIETVSDDGRAQIWDVEIASLSTLRRRKISSDFIKIGDEISVAGNPHRAGTNEIYVRNILLPDGSEIVLENVSTTVFQNQSIIGLSQLERPGDSSAPEKGIFRVWSTAITAGTGLWLTEYPLTQSARKSLNNFDPIIDDITANCRSKGMPTIMEQPYPMEILQLNDGNISIHLEEYNTIRKIIMTENKDSSNEEKTLLGKSYGRWEGRVLIVETSNVNWGYLNRGGIPLSDQAEMIEYFTLVEDGSRLDYRMHVNDPINLTTSIVLGSEENKHWLWYPENEVQVFNCVS